MEFAGEFETHITVNVVDDSEVEAIRVWAANHNLKFHHIVLEKGDTPSQPMVSRRGRGGFSEQLDWANDHCRRLGDEGLVASRVKIEAAPGNEDVPGSDETAAANPTRYFEHHVKLILDRETDLRALAGLAQEHGAHLSRNVRSSLPDGRNERFVTQRCYRVGRSTAAQRLRVLAAALGRGGYSILNVEEEYVVHDSNLELDAGWLESGGHPCSASSGDS